MWKTKEELIMERNEVTEEFNPMKCWEDMKVELLDQICGKQEKN